MASEERIWNPLQLSLRTILGVFLFVAIVTWFVKYVLNLNAAVAVFAGITFPLIWLIMWFQDHDGCRSEWEYNRELKTRQKLSSEEFFKRYYADSGVRKEIVEHLLSVSASYWQVDPALIRPHDDYGRINGDCDTSEFVDVIESEFKITIPEKELENLDGSFETLVRYLNDHVPVSDSIVS